MVVVQQKSLSPGDLSLLGWICWPWSWSLCLAVAIGVATRCRWALGVVDGRYLPLDISGRGFRERKKDENEPRNMVARFVTHRVGHLSSSSSLLPSSSLCRPSSSSSSSRPSPHPSSVSTLLLLLIVVSSSGFARRRRRRFIPCRCLTLCCLPPSPDSPSSETNPPTSLWKGVGRIGLQPRL